MADIEHNAQFLKALHDPSFFGDGNSTVELCETHISWVFLTERFAYKIKKPLDLGFLDFTTLEKRHFFCQEELRLNQRQAPDIYLEVLPITGSPEQPYLNGKGMAFEYCLKMHRFDNRRVYENLFFEDSLTKDNMCDLADALNALHKTARIFPAESPFGTPARLIELLKRNISEMRPWVSNAENLQRLDRIDQLNLATINLLAPLIEKRRQNGFIRECHADVHLGNIVEKDGRPVLFDCIEFNEEFRCIDTMSDASFMIMDLMVHQRHDLAWAFLNAFLQQNGDYSALPLLPVYLSYRAAIRAKVTFINIPQLNNQKKVNEEKNAQRYLEFACDILEKKIPTLYIMNGLSGSGKSFAANTLSAKAGAVHITSDIERKRLAGLTSLQSSKSIDGGIYTKDMSQKTYDAMLKACRFCLIAGFNAVADATFLQQKTRSLFIDLAQELNSKCYIIQCQCQESDHQGIVEERLRKSQDPSEADWQVVELQEKSMQPLTAREMNICTTITDFDLRKLNPLFPPK